MKTEINLPKEELIRVLELILDDVKGLEPSHDTDEYTMILIENNLESLLAML